MLKPNLPSSITYHCIKKNLGQGGNAVRYLLKQLTDPVLAPIRCFLPSLGGLDFSPLVLILATQFALDIIGQS
jgi:uncharacterized protein YggT (Ycf19 family)